MVDNKFNTLNQYGNMEREILRKYYKSALKMKVAFRTA